MIRNRADMVAGVALLALAAVLYLDTVGTGFGRDEIARDPVWFPRVLIVLLALAAAGLLARGLALAGEPAARPRWRRLGAAAAAVGGYFLVFDLAGFLISSLVFLPAMAVLLGYRRPVATALVTIFFVAGVWYCFADLFVVRPPGIGIDDIAGWL